MREANENNYQQKTSQFSPKTVISQMNLPAVEYEILPSQAYQLLPGARGSIMEGESDSLDLRFLSGRDLDTPLLRKQGTLPGKAYFRVDIRQW